METTSRKTFVRRFIELVDDPQAAWELLASQPDEVRLKFFRGLVQLKQFQNASQRQVRNKFKEENGVSRSWAHARNNPEYHERHKARNREYARKKREAKNVLGE
jgi:hypothetical protein